MLEINGTRVGVGDDFREVGRYDVAKLLHPGQNTLAVTATNGGDGPNPAGLIAALRIAFAGSAPLEIVTDSAWQAARPAAGAEKPESAVWQPALPLGPFGMPPWGRIGARPTDIYAAFRGAFTLEKAAEISLDIFGAHWFSALLDGVFLTEGPYRFPADHPEYETRTVRLPGGRHILAATVRCEGVSTRMIRGDLIPPFFLCRASAGPRPIEITWKAALLPGYCASGQRVNPQFAWIEWVDTRENPADWQAPHFDDSAWHAPIPVAVAALSNLRPVRIGAVQQLPVHPVLIAAGTLTGPFDTGDRPAWKTDSDLPWYARDLHPAAPPTGVWRRYDLGQVRLGRPSFTLEAPPGAIVEIACSEELRDGRVTPFIPLSAGLSRNLDRFVARGGRQTFAPIAPKGGRYLEIHVAAPPPSLRFLAAAYTHRTYFGDPVGAFESADSRLDAVWKLGIATLRACAEDAVIDNPTRERGQWTGDALPSLHIAAAGFNDLRIARRALEQSALCARADGLVAGLCPGGDSHLSTYAAQWFTAVVDYFDLTGDRTLLEDLYPAAVRNLAAFTGGLGPHGIRDSLGWAFVDWGYPGTPGTDSDIALNLHVLSGIRSFQRWTRLLERPAPAADTLATAVQSAIDSWLAPRIAAGRWPEIGYHRTALALRCGAVPIAHVSAAVAALQQHILACFPNNPAAPRLANPDIHSDQLITPYFAHYAFPVLYAAGETDFVLDQYRRCWGWTLDNGLTTQPEVFDLGWSHCHVWAASPTWQLSTYLLGLQPRFSHGPNHFDLTLRPGSLPHAAGAIPFPNSHGAVSVRWTRTAPDTIRLTLAAPETLHLHHPGDPTPFATVTKPTNLLLKSTANTWRAAL